jgi:cell division topological specificity factor
VAFLNMFGKEKERPTADTADDRLALVLSYQRSDIDERKLKEFQSRLIDLCNDFGYDVVGQVEVRPQSQKRNNMTVLNASIPVRIRTEAKEDDPTVKSAGLT